MLGIWPKKIKAWILEQAGIEFDAEQTHTGLRAVKYCCKFKAQCYINRLEILSGDRVGQNSIRINDQCRVFYNWTGIGSVNVEIM